MKNNSRYIFQLAIFICLLFVSAYASTSGAYSNEYYYNYYGKNYPGFNSPYTLNEVDGVVEDSTGAIKTHVADYVINGKNGFKIPFVRSYSSDTAAYELGEYAYANQKQVVLCYTLKYNCSYDDTIVQLRFSTQLEALNAPEVFKGNKCDNINKKWYDRVVSDNGNYTYTQVEREPVIEYENAYYQYYSGDATPDKAFLKFTSFMRISKPALSAYDWTKYDGGENVYLMFQDIRGEFSSLELRYSETDDIVSLVDSTQGPMVSYSKYTANLVDNEDASVTATHPLGFVYDMTLTSDDGEIYYIKRNVGNYHYHDVLAVADRYGNTYLISNADREYSITTPEGVVYKCDYSGITKTVNEDTTKLVWYYENAVNSEKDTNEYYEDDDEYVFKVIKNSGTTPSLSSEEDNVTKYYMKQEYKFGEILKDKKGLTYYLPYKIEFPSGLVKHIDYDCISNWKIKPDDDYVNGYYYPVKSYYEEDNGVIKYKSEYDYTNGIYRYGNYKISYFTDSVRNTEKGINASLINYKSYDQKGRVVTETIESVTSSSIYRTLDYEYDNYRADAKVSSIDTYEITKSYTQSASHTVNYEYIDRYYLSDLTDGDYTEEYTYHEDGNYIPSTIIYQKDEKSTVTTENILTEDKKSIAKTNVYENDVLARSISYTYDSYGNVASETTYVDDDTLVVTLYSYVYAEDGGFTLTTTNTGLKDADGNTLPDVTTVSVYDSEYNLISHTDANGNTTLMTYDNIGRLLSVSYPDGTSENYTYDITEGITTYTSPNGTVYKAYFDAWGNKLKTTVMINGEEQMLESFVYDKAGNIYYYRRYIDAEHYVRAEYNYDYLDRLVKERIYNGTTLLKTTVYEYTISEDDDERPLHTVTVSVSGDDGTYAQYSETTNYRGFLTESKYFTNDGERTTTCVPDYVGNILSVTDLEGNVTLTQYDALNNPIKVTYADGTSVQTNYNLAGLVNSTVDAMGNTTHYQYDTLGRTISVTTPFDNLNDAITKTYYDPNGNVISSKTLSSFDIDDEKYTTVTNAYDSRNRLINTAVYPDEESAIYTRYQYDAMGNPTKVVSGLTSADAPDIEGQVVTYSYDALGRMISTTTPDALTETAEYDLAGRVTKTTDKAGRNTVFTYDMFDNITNTQKGDNTVSYTYNVLGNRTSMTDDTGLTTYTYNPYGELTQESIGSIIKSYTYDDLGRRQSIGITNGDEQILSQTYTYDNVGRLLGVTNGNDTVSYTYDNNSNMLTSSYNGTTYKTYMYNNANLPIYSKLNYDGVEDTTNYMYNPDGNLFMSVGTNQMSMYYYDGANRLVHENTTLNGGTYSDTFSYDTFGNRVGLTHKDFADDTTVNTVYTYNSINQLLTKTDSSGTTAYTYDTVGNMTNVTDNGQTVKEYTYDDFNRLDTATINGITSSYTYNGDNLRQTKTVNGVTTRHIYDGSDIVADICTDTTVFVRGNGLALLKNATTTQLYGIGSRGDVEHLISPNETDNLYTYTAYGVATGDNNYIYNPFGYAGEYQDLCSGLIYLRNRYYDPSIGRFITEDPARDGLNWYVYANNNPVNYIDPLGLGAWLIHGTNLNNDPTPEKTWTQDFRNYLEKNVLSEGEKTYTPKWSGGNDKNSREKAAEQIAQEIITYHQNNPDEQIRLIGHSHGGNVAVMVVNILAEKNIDVETLVTIATPVRGYQLEKGATVKQHINVYNNSDQVQVRGGHVALQVTSNLFFGISGTSAGRTFTNATNINAKDAGQWYNPIDSHSSMHSNIAIWKKYIAPKFQK